MSNKDVINRPEAKFTRRRCPQCGTGKYKRLIAAKNPNLRQCEKGHVFHLFNDGVREGPAKALPAVKSGVIPAPVREREFKLLKRNPFELRDLALLTR